LRKSQDEDAAAGGCQRSSVVVVAIGSGKCFYAQLLFGLSI